MNLTAGIIFALGAVFGPATPASAAPAIVATVPQPQTTEQYVRSYFADEPVMIAIAGCESHFIQQDADGNVLKNPHSSAVGVFQIMASVHASVANDTFGLNIYTLQGNAAYARYLYDTEGTAPWNDSKSCWSKGLSVKKAAASTTLAIASK